MKTHILQVDITGELWTGTEEFRGRSVTINNDRTDRMKTIRFLLFSLIAIGCSAPATKQEGVDLSLDAMLTTDPAVRVGVLDNGMKYYVRENSRPEGRAELRLAVQAGSILEDDDQRGLAHFVEHMAFNGTENFEKNQMIKYLESIGMRFGADLNAFTSYDMTVYMLQVPSEDEAILNKGLLVLHDWAGGILFEEDAIDDERGVIVEEMRSRLSGDSRVNEDHMKVIYGGTKYADRSPIGTKDILLNSPYEAFRRFYRDWYRPDLMAIVAVGDFDADAVEKEIKSMFSQLENPENPRTRTKFEIPVHNGTRYSIAFDPEATGAGVSVGYKLGLAARETVRDYRQSMIDGIVSGMLNQRFQTLVREEGSPLLFSFGGAGIGLAGARTFTVNGRVKEGRFEDGLKVILTEIERMKRHGFTEQELERQKKSMLVNIDQYYQERDKTESSSYAREYYSNHTSGEAFPGIEVERDLYYKYVPALTLEEVNSHAMKMAGVNGRYITAGGPETDKSGDLSQSDLESVVASVEKSTIDPYMEEAVKGELFTGNPTPGSIMEEKTINDVGVTEWTLSNGMRVVLRPTDFKNNEILMSGYSPGGTSMISDRDYIAAATASGVVSQGGLAGFDQNQLQRYMSDKVAGASASIGELYENLSGSASNEDLELMFQMTHLRFTSPRKDPEALRLLKTQIAANLETSGSNPNQVFGDTMSYVMSGYHLRSKPWTEATLDQLDLDKSYAIYLDRFSNAGDFTLFFVGSFDLETIRPLVEKYLASLPGTSESEKWRNVGRTTPTGDVKRIVRKGLEEKAAVRIVYTGEIDFTMENRFKLRSMVEVLQMKVRETLREEKGGVYSPSAWSSASKYPDAEYQVNVYFGCDPERVDELVADVDKIVASLKNELVEAEYVEKVAEIQRKQRETSLKQNQSWLQSLAFYYRNGEPVTNILTIIDLPDTLTAAMVKETANRYLAQNRMTFILLPE